MWWRKLKSEKWRIRNHRSHQEERGGLCLLPGCVFWVNPLFPAVLRLKARALCALGQCFTTESCILSPLVLFLRVVNSLDLKLALVKPGTVGLPALWRLTRTLPGLHIYSDVFCIHFFTSQPSGWFRASGPSCWSTLWQGEATCCIAARDCHLVGLLSRSLATPALGKAVSRRHLVEEWQHGLLFLLLHHT